jgi:flagellar hook-basal body complex protein FliE
MTAGLEAITGVGAVAGGTDLASLAQLYRSQVLSSDPATAATAAASGTPSTSGADFSGALGKSLGTVEGLDQNASKLAVQAATGDLSDIQDYVIAATQAQLATQLTTTVRNKAVDAFNEIMRMPL